MCMETCMLHALCSKLKWAKVALKHSKMKDYYKILGVLHDCNKVDIKKAYQRKSLLQYYPVTVLYLNIVLVSPVTISPGLTCA